MTRDQQPNRSAAFDRMWADLRDVGRDRGTGGYRRFAWNDADLACREWFVQEAHARGLDVVVDRNGNQWAWWGDPDRDGPGVVTGSHLDSVPDGGGYDGPLGVMSAFLALDELRSRGVTPSVPVGIVNFTDEEGARFGVACAGSRLMTGGLDPDRARGLTDRDGNDMAEAMRRAGHDPNGVGADTEARARIGMLVELHIEQGRGLADPETAAAVGVASGIWPHGRWRLDLVGEANHAGTTRLRDRSDPTLDLARTVVAAREQAEQLGAVATIGRVEVSPNGTNAIPSLVRAWLDARAPAEDVVRELVGSVERAAGATAVEESWTPRVDFEAALRDRIAATLGDAPVLATGAGHDAGILAASGIPAAMLFVRNPTGVSHSPAEHAEAADCVAGIDALATVLADLVVR